MMIINEHALAGFGIEISCPSIIVTGGAGNFSDVGVTSLASASRVEASLSWLDAEHMLRWQRGIPIQNVLAGIRGPCPCGWLLSHHESESCRKQRKQHLLSISSSSET